MLIFQVGPSKPIKRAIVIDATRQALSWRMCEGDIWKLAKLHKPSHTPFCYRSPPTEHYQTEIALFMDSWLCPYSSNMTPNWVLGAKLHKQSWYGTLRIYVEKNGPNQLLTLCWVGRVFILTKWIIKWNFKTKWLCNSIPIYHIVHVRTIDGGSGVTQSGLCSGVTWSRTHMTYLQMDSWFGLFL